MAEHSETEPLLIPPSIHAVRDSRDSHLSRTLIICLDGTGDQFDNDNSNVVHFVTCLKKDHPRQVTYYQSGIGTYDEKGLSNGIAAAVDMSIGSGLGLHIKDAYHFLMQNYNEHDKICLFGFSRGAYTVRCLAGMLHKVGLLPAHNVAQVDFAFNFYKDDTEEGRHMSADFKNTFCTDVSVYFIGVWDSVSSVGFIPRQLPFSKGPTNKIHYFRHAMALDEHRAKFKCRNYVDEDEDPSLKIRPNETLHTNAAEASSHEGISTTQPVVADNRIETNKTSMIDRVMALPDLVKPYGIERLPEPDLHEFEKTKDINHTDVLEVWFCGGHGDVGGGAVKNWERHVLARIPLRWMIRQCFECNTGIIFKTAALAEIGIDIHSLWPMYKTPKRPTVGPSPTHLNKYAAGEIAPLQRRSTALGLQPNKSDPLEKYYKHKFSDNTKMKELVDMLPEQVEDYFDAMAPINDQLKLAKAWWILEIWPVALWRLNLISDSNEWEKVVRPNLGRYRAIRDLEPKMHWTVEQRMLDNGYKIQARTHKNVQWKIVV